MEAQSAPVAVITGASSGIGKEAALTLAARGWRIIGTGRDQQRLEDARAEIQAAPQGGEVTMLRADLSLLREAERLAGEIAGITERVDLLINNAGGITDRLVMTEEGLEANFAGNHLGPFVLTDGLLPLLYKAAKETPAGTVRIVQTASDASEMIPGIDLDDLQSLNGFDPGRAYCSGKLANVLFTRGLAQRVGDKGIVTHCYQPGPVASNFQSYASEQSQAYMRTIQMLTVAEGADTMIWLATASEPAQSNGLYWMQRGIRTPNPIVEDAAYLQRFWEEARKLVNGVGVTLDLL